MRRLGIVSDQLTGSRIRDYLYTLGIEAHIDRVGAEWTLWVHEEDKVPLARQEFEQFLKNSTDLKYAAAEEQADKLRNQRVDEDVAARKRRVILAQRWQGMQSQIPVTAVLIMLSIWVAIVTRLGMNENAIPRFQIADWHFDEGTQRIVHDSVWEVLQNGHFHRWISPIFLHFGPMHLLFNMSATLAFGRAIEQRSGTPRFLGIVLVTGLVSNFSQFVMVGPNFGGMSGVDFGLFGFLWMKSRFAPDYGVALGRDYIFQFLFFAVLCLFGVFGPVANTAHFSGLLTGMLLAMIPVLPRLWRHYLRHRE